MARPFNLMGNGMSTRLFIGNLYNQIYKYKKGIIAEIVLGNLENRRDYIDVSDAVEIYIKIMNQGSSGEVYNVGSGKPTTIVDLLKVILKNNRLDDSIVRQEINYKIGKNDVEEIYADLGKINSLQ